MDKFKKVAIGLLTTCIFLLGSVVTIVVIKYFPSSVNETKIKNIQEIKITENGIADSVAKVYDAVVIVKSLNNQKLISSGTGFVFKVDNKKAYILTNAHVVNGADKVMVTLTNEKNLEATLVGMSEYDDIAVLSIDKNDSIKEAVMHEEENIRVGDTVFTVGAPLDTAYSWTVTRGIVSGLDRMVEVSLSNTTGADYVMKVIQTDAAINTGNSGGPLCNINGEVIGITSMKLVSSGIEGIGFALPIKEALIMADRLINKEEIVIPYLGIGMLNVKEANYSRVYAELIQDQKVEKGIIITEVEDNESAQKAGLKVNDIVIEFDGKTVDSIAYFRYVLLQTGGYILDIKENMNSGINQGLNVTLGKRK